MNFKKLNLCEKTALLNYIKNKFDVTNEKNPKYNQTNIIIKLDDQEALLNLFFNSDGTTTIGISQGKNKELNQQIAEIIKNDCILSDKKRVDFTLNNYQLLNNEFEMLLEFLKEELKCNIKNETHTNYKLYTINYKKEKFVIKKYNNSSIQFQGKPITIYSKIIEYLSAIPNVNLKHIIKIQEKAFEIQINQDEIETEFYSKLPKANNILCNTTKKIIQSGLIHQKIEVSYSDYSIITYPFLRSLESTLKKIWRDILQETIPNKNGFNNKFECIESVYQLKDRYKELSPSQTLSDIIEDIYTYYNENRHTLFHSDGNPEMTRIIEQRDEALTISEKCLELIERLCDEYEKIQNTNE